MYLGIYENLTPVKTVQGVFVMKKRNVFAAPVLVLAVVLAACGGGEDKTLLREGMKWDVRPKDGYGSLQWSSTPDQVFAAFQIGRDNNSIERWGEYYGVPQDRVQFQLNQIGPDNINRFWFRFYGNRVGGHPLFGQPSSHTTVRTVPYTAVQ
jgi:hypothetical protein